MDKAKVSWSDLWDLQTIPPDLWVSENNRRVAHLRKAPARAKKLSPCKHCGAPIGVREGKYGHEGCTRVPSGG